MTRKDIENIYKNAVWLFCRSEKADFGSKYMDFQGFNKLRDDSSKFHKKKFEP